MFVTAAAVAAPPGADRVARELDAAIRSAKNCQVSVAVLDALNGDAWFARRADEAQRPASVQKLFVTAAALERFGVDFAFETGVYLAGDELWIIGAGDPGLGDERIEARRGNAPTAVLDEWAAALKQRNVSTIRSVVIDDFVFDQEYRHPDWPAAQSSAWYQAPVGGLNFNDNCLDAQAVRDGDELRLLTVPELPASFIVNRLTLGEKHAPTAARVGDSDRFEFRGSVARSDVFSPIAAGRPTVFVGHAIRYGLQQRGVAVTGDVIRRRIATSALPQAQRVALRRTPLSDVLWRCNTFSQNMFADCLLKALAAYEPNGERAAQPGSWQGGVDVLRHTLERLGVSDSRAEFRDGSGLSHQNRASAMHIARLLVRMRGHPQTDAFQASLAQPGQDGSMQRRYNHPSLVGKLRGKTGTLSGVSALAGYVQRGPDELAFAVLISGEAPAGLIDRICRILADSAEKP